MRIHGWIDANPFIFVEVVHRVLHTSSLVGMVATMAGPAVDVAEAGLDREDGVGGVGEDDRSR